MHGRFAIFFSDGPLIRCPCFSNSHAHEKKKVNSMGHKKGHQSKKGLIGEGWFWRKREMVAHNKGRRWLKFFIYIYGTIKEKIYSQDCAVTRQVKGLTTKPENWIRSLECMWWEERTGCMQQLSADLHTHVSYHMLCPGCTHTYIWNILVKIIIKTCKTKAPCHGAHL